MASHDALFGGPVAIPAAPAVPTFAPVAMPSRSAQPIAVPPRPMPLRLGAFGRFMIAAAVAGGALVALYRNDMFLEGARALGQEQRFIGMEQRVFGGPSFGMLRELLLGEPSEAPPPRSDHGRQSAP